MIVATPGSVTQSPVQLRYALLVEAAARLGLVLLVLSFAAYVLGLMPPQVALERLPALWGLPVEDYLQRSGAPAGWSWLGQLQHGDVAGMLGIAVLAGCSLPALLALLPLYLQQRDRTYAALCVAEVAVVLLAASGWLSNGL